MKVLKTLIVFVIMNLINIISGKSCADQSALAGCLCDPLCGSDGFTYTDQCFLDAYNQNCNKNVKAVSEGPCKKIKLVPVTECYPANGVCPKNKKKPKIYDPVCSTSGEHSSPCVFHFERKNNTSLEFVKCGKC